MSKILLADDSITIQKVVNLTFTDEGINVVTVGNGELALKKLNEEPFDLVLADIFMPGRNGYEVCEYIKSSPQFSEVPVLLLVGAFEPFDKAEAARVRADGHLTKPFESRILIETVKRMLAEVAALRAQHAPEPPAGAYQGQVVGWDVPTSPVPQQLSGTDAQHDVSYDPYVSTAKLPAIDFTEEPQPQDVDEDATLAFGSAASTRALFSEPPAEPPPSMFEPAPEPEPVEVLGEAPMPHALEGPPDSVAGFSYHEDESGPLEPIALDEEAPAVESHEMSIGYQPIQQTDSPLDLPDMALLEPARTEVERPVETTREPLLETFSEVAESTLRVDAAPDPELVPNAHADEPSAMEVGPTEGIISAWDPEAQPEKPAEPEPEASYLAEIEMEDTAETVEQVRDDEPVGEPFGEPVTYEAEQPEVVAEEIAAAPVNGSSPSGVPQDLIDEVVRRTVERMSDDVIREIAWEVVPDLAERLIRKHLADRS